MLVFNIVSLTPNYESTNVQNVHKAITNGTENMMLDQNEILQFKRWEGNC